MGCEGGSMKEVNNDNLGQYLEANLRYRMLDRIKLPLGELLLGFFDVIPEPALTVFDSQELELLLCGLPTIDMDDWQSNTLYSGRFESKKEKAQVCHWFWDVVTNDFDSEMKARLLQFVTGTSGLPSCKGTMPILRNLPFMVCPVNNIITHVHIHALIVLIYQTIVRKNNWKNDYDKPSSCPHKDLIL